MGGRVVPDDYWRGDLWSTFVHGLSAVQFNHRLFAYGLLAVGAAQAIAAARARHASSAIKALAALAFGLLLAQAGLGIATLWAGDPLWLALLHQANAAILLSVAVALAWRSRRA
jgi:cytochrome c oxidase assembly protein subunit 15